MPAFCRTEIESWDDLTDWEIKLDAVWQAMACLQVLSWLIGLVLIFVWRWSEEKSCFIWGLWTVISLGNIVLIAEIVLDIKYFKGMYTEEYMYSDLKKFINVLTVASLCLFSIVHWILALKYVEVIFNFQLILDRKQENKLAKQKRLRCIIWTINSTFYTVMVLFFFAFFWYKDGEELTLQILQTVVCQMLPAFLMVFAVQKLRRSIKDLRDFSLREQLMNVHVVVFACNICFNLAVLVSDIFFYRGQDWSRTCRSMVSDYVLTQVAQVSNVVILWLVIFMSLQLTKPPTKEWQDSIVGCRDESLDPAYQAACEKALRLHKAAVEDANRQIQILQALLHRSDRTELLTNPHDSLNSLNTEERNILGDSQKTETEEEMFARVRREAVERMDV